jgi:hypothetical protein
MLCSAAHDSIDVSLGGGVVRELWCVRGGVGGSRGVRQERSHAAGRKRSGGPQLKAEDRGDAEARCAEGTHTPMVLPAELRGQNHRRAKLPLRSFFSGVEMFKNTSMQFQSSVLARSCLIHPSFKGLLDLSCLAEPRPEAIRFVLSDLSMGIDTTHGYKFENRNFHGR